MGIRGEGTGGGRLGDGYWMDDKSGKGDAGSMCGMLDIVSTYMIWRERGGKGGVGVGGEI